MMDLFSCLAGGGCPCKGVSGTKGMLSWLGNRARFHWAKPREFTEHWVHNASCSSVKDDIHSTRDPATFSLRHNGLPALGRAGLDSGCVCV